MSDEHISIRLGLDKRDFERGLAGVKGAFSGIAHVLAGVGIGIGIGEISRKLVEMGFSALETAERLKTQSEALDVTTDFLQRFTLGAQQNGSSSDKASEALNRFTKNLKENGDTGESVEKQFRGLLDKIQNTPSPVDRATLVFKNLGKGTSDLIPLLSQGSEGFYRLTESISRLSDSEIEKLSKLKSKWEEVKNIAAVYWAGKIVDAAAEFDASKRALEIMEERDRHGSAYYARALAEAKAEEAARQKSADEAMATRKAAMEDANKKAALDSEADKNITEYLKNEQDIARQDKEILALKQQQADAAERILDASAKLSGLTGPGGANDQAKHDLSGSTLSDIAGSRAFTRQGAQNIRAAQAAMNAEAFAKQARIQGRPDLADKATDYALGIRKRLGALTGAEQNPLAGVQENTKAAAEHLQTLLDKFSDGSAVVTAQGGE